VLKPSPKKESAWFSNRMQTVQKEAFLLPDKLVAKHRILIGKHD